MEERRRVEEHRRLDEDRRREASRIFERVARERAPADKRRKEDEARARERWAHRSEMLPGASSHLEDLHRSIDVSLNTSSSIPHPVAAAGSDRVEVSLNQQQSVSSLNVSPLAPAVPEPVGSSVPPPALGLNVTGSKAADTRFIKFKGSCMNCFGEHHINVCQNREPWDYKEPFFGSEEFGFGLYSIHVSDIEAHLWSS
jgi:hypothetical protein